jgi:hypothetical protein
MLHPELHPELGRMPALLDAITTTPTAEAASDLNSTH